jgi:hypothetical protein
MMEPDHVNKTPSHDFTLAAAGGNICDGPRRLDDHGQELLAERGQAKRANQNCWFATRFEFCVRVRPGSVTFAARDESERQWSVIRVGQNPDDT